MSHVRSSLTVLACSALAATLSAQPALAQGSPWIAEPGTGSVNISYVNQNALEFFRQTTKVKGPLEATGANLGQNTVWFGVNYAINDAVALDVQSAWARSFVAGAVGPAAGQRATAACSIHNAVTWRIVDEARHDASERRRRVGTIIAGGYTPATSTRSATARPRVGRRSPSGSSGRGRISRGRLPATHEHQFNRWPSARAWRRGKRVDKDMSQPRTSTSPGPRSTIGVDYRIGQRASGIDIGARGSRRAGSRSSFRRPPGRGR